jgi:hypothetical protein
LRGGEFADYWGGDHHGGIPIFVPTHVAPVESRYGRVHYVTEGIAACVEQAKAIQLMPVLLGQGRRLFEGVSPEHIELDLVRTMAAPGVVHLRYDVRRDDSMAAGRAGP